MKDRKLFLGKFTTPIGEIEGRAERTPQGWVAKAALTAYALEPWVAVIVRGFRDSDITVGWYRGVIEQPNFEMVSLERECPITEDTKVTLRSVARAMLTLVMDEGLE